MLKVVNLFGSWAVGVENGMRRRWRQLGMLEKVGVQKITFPADTGCPPCGCLPVREKGGGEVYYLLYNPKARNMTHCSCHRVVWNYNEHMVVITNM